MGQLFSASASGVLDEFLFPVFLGIFICLFVLFLFLSSGWGGGNGEIPLDGTSGGHVRLLHKMGFAVRSDGVAQGFIQSDLENLGGWQVLSLSEQRVPLLEWGIQTA